jgi:hypothetical protein
MKCCFCGKEVASIDEAVEAGWYPDFWQGDVNWQGPVCCDCQQEHLFTDESGEYVLKPGHPVPQAAERLVAVGKERKARLIATGKFPLGQVVATPGALRALEESGQDVAFFLDKHRRGDWGDLGDEDKQANDQALVDGSRILSSYRTLKGVKIWMITEAEDDQGRRAATTLLRADEY